MNARVDYGDLEVVVPSDVAVRVYGRGAARLCGRARRRGRRSQRRRARHRAGRAGAGRSTRRCSVRSVRVDPLPTMSAAMPLPRLRPPRRRGRDRGGLCGNRAVPRRRRHAGSPRVRAARARGRRRDPPLPRALGRTASRRATVVGGRCSSLGAGVLLLHAVGLSNRLGRRRRPRSPPASRSRGAAAGAFAATLLSPTAGSLSPRRHGAPLRGRPPRRLAARARARSPARCS